MNTNTYTVKGMTCDHCVGTVTSAIKAIDGIEGVDVALDTGLVQVSGTKIDDDQIKAAVAETGYEVVA